MVRFLVYGRGSCPYCLKAVELLRSLNKEYVFFDEEDREELEKIKVFYNHKTVPIVLTNDLSTGSVRLVGGFTELKEFIND